MGQKQREHSEFDTAVGYLACFQIIQEAGGGEQQALDRDPKRLPWLKYQQ